MGAALDSCKGLPAGLLRGVVFVWHLGQQRLFRVHWTVECCGEVELSERYRGAIEWKSESGGRWTRRQPNCFYPKPHGVTTFDISWEIVNR